MDDAIIDELILVSNNQKIWGNRFKNHRYLYNELTDIDEEYFIGIKGIRGIGKTVLMLQLASKTSKSIYFSADSTFLKPFTLYEISKKLEKRGYKNIFIDEIHRKHEWDSDIKTLYDEHQVRIFFSGSSALDITKTSADLSRRVVLKELKPASFREFLNIRKQYDIPSYSLHDIIKNKTALTKKYSETVRYVDEYMTYGGVLYPKKGFFDALENTIRKVVLQDLSALRNINIKYETDVYKLLYLITRSPSYQTNYSAISRELDTSKTFAVRIVNDLAQTGIIQTVFPCKKKNIDVKKQPKIFLTIPLRHFFSSKGFTVNKGSMREEFFINHKNDVCYIKSERGEKTADFRVNDVIIEIGGESKTRYQHPDYIAVDGLSTEENKIPLFLFGFIY